MSKYTVILLAVSLCGTVTLGQEKPAKAPDAGRDLWILSGQSNACGRGQLPGLPSSPAVEAFNPSDGKWIAAVDPLPGMASKGVGPWQAAAVEYASRTSRKVRLAGSARGGSSIELWNPTDGPVWKSLSGVLDRAGKDASVFLWYQGEADCKCDHDEYKASFKQLTERVRKNCGNPRSRGGEVIDVHHETADHGPRTLHGPCGQHFSTGETPVARKPGPH